ncbi:hypothetical protein DL769_001806 [Monosporascus sp. CRB-8-3]|nr:hypothetical protein DL769_001806 [Monosporascus sp. CRB-8-3]
MVLKLLAYDLLAGVPQLLLACAGVEAVEAEDARVHDAEETEVIAAEGQEREVRRQRGAEGVDLAGLPAREHVREHVRGRRARVGQELERGGVRPALAGREVRGDQPRANKRLPHVFLKDMAHKRRQKAVDYETGQIVGHCRGILPDRLTGEWLEAQAPAVGSDKGKEYAEKFAKAVFEYRPELNGSDVRVVPIKNRLWDVKNIWGRGIATLLVESRIARAEKMGVDIFVLAFKAAVGVDQRLGFKILDQLVQDHSKYGSKGEYETCFLENEVGKRS